MLGAPGWRTPVALNLILMTAGSYGDVQPFLVLARSLKDRGHRVLLAAEGVHEPMVRDAGLEFSALTKVRAARLSQRSGLVRALRRYWMVEGFTGWLHRRDWLLGLTEPAFELIASRRRLGDTVVVGKATIFGARLAHEKLAVPLVTVHLTPGTIRSEYDAPGLPLPNGRTVPYRLMKRCAWALIDGYVRLVVEPGMNRIRAGLDLPPLRRPLMRWMNSPDLALGLFPAWYAEPQPDWPPNFHAVGFPLAPPGTQGSTLPDGLEAFLDAGEPPVVFTVGSAGRDVERFFRVSVEACVRSGRRALLQTTRTGVIPPRLPETIQHFPYMPYGSVFPRAAAVVHNGGIGTTARALAAGIPQIIMPIAEDHRENGRRVRRLKAGTVIHGSSYSVATLNRQLQRLLDSAAVAEACSRFRERIAPTNPIDESCLRIEEFARQHYAGAECE